ncbi:MAG: flagellar basal-body rod protein FlgF [Fibrobacterota bacterium]
MIKGMLTSTQGMKFLMRKQEQVSNNLANANTTGYKKARLFQRTYIDFINNDLQEPFMNDDVSIDEVGIDFSQGSLVKTGNSLDLALKSDGFFTVAGQGEELYTRNGCFKLNSENFIVDSEGRYVMGENGPMRIDGDHMEVHRDGKLYVDGSYLDTLKVSVFDKPYQLKKTGDSLYRVYGDAMPGKAAVFDVRQGFLESSNIKPVEEMVKMMAAFRNYEADQKAIQAQDQTLDKAVNQVGTVR